jgi:hypothetical protein
MKIKTALDWFYEQLPIRIKNAYREDFEQAKKMEKEQIMNDYWEGGQDVPLTLQKCQEYYNETYGK